MIPTILASNINSLNKIFDYKKKKNIINIPSKNKHFDIKQKRVKNILTNKEIYNIRYYDYSIFQLKRLHPKNKFGPVLLKMKNGDIKLQIPFVHLFTLYKE